MLQKSVRFAFGKKQKSRLIILKLKCICILNKKWTDFYVYLKSYSSIINQIFLWHLYYEDTQMELPIASLSPQRSEQYQTSNMNGYVPHNNPTREINK